MSHPDGVLVYSIEDQEKKIGHEQTFQLDLIPDEKIKIKLHNGAFQNLTNIDFTLTEPRPGVTASSTDKIFLIEDNRPEISLSQDSHMLYRIIGEEAP